MTRTRAPVRATERIPWHPAFFEALQLELESYSHLLEFSFEYQLTEEPLKMDVLVIKKAQNVVIEKNIAAIFRHDNILEFKSPGDYISVEDFYKIYGYGCFYASLNKRAISDITLSFVGNRYPRELIRHLKTARNYAVEQAGGGIYAVRGDIVGIQIIETKKLPEGENIWLGSLRNDLDISRARSIIKESDRRGKEARIRAYLNAVLLANPEAIEEALRMGNETLTLEKVLKNAGLTEKWIAEGKAEGKAEGEAIGEEKKALEIAKNLITKGWNVNEVAEITKLSINKVKTLYSGWKK
jgi:hypothetical protein